MSKAPITIGTVVTFLFHGFFNSLERSSYLSFFSHSFSFILWSPGTSLQFCKFSFFLMIIIRSGLLAGIRWSVCMWKSHRSLCVTFSRTSAGLCIYHLLVWSNKFSCTFPCGSPCRTSLVSSYTPSVLICCIHLLCDWSFRLSHHICYVIEFCLFSLWYD